MYIAEPFPLDSTNNRNKQPITILQTLGGRQLGEYFGASFEAVDMDGDGLEDLVVGAPLASHERVRHRRAPQSYVKVNMMAISKCKSCCLNIFMQLITKLVSNNSHYQFVSSM